MKQSYLYAAATILIWSSMATVSALLLNSLNHWTVLAVSALFAFFAMLFSVLFSKKRALLLQYRFRDYIRMILIGIPGIFLYNFFYYAGAMRLPASQAFTVNYLWPIMSIVFACLLLKEKLTCRKGIAILLSFAGVVVIAGGGLGDGSSLSGILLCIGAAVSYGLFTSLVQKWPYDKQIMMTLTFLFTCIICFLMQWKIGFVALSLPQIGGLAYNGIFVLALATLLWTRALSLGGTARISNLAYVTPFVSLIWTFLILKEPIEWRCIIGLCIIILGIFIQLNPFKKEARS